MKSVIGRYVSKLRSPLTWRQACPWLAAALVLLALGVRMQGLAAADLTFDEAASAFVSGKPYADMLAYLRVAVREHPPAYYILLRTWSLLAGRSEYALRFSAVCFGVLGVAFVYRAGRQALGRAAALAAAALLAVQPFHVYYSQEARMYMLLAVEGLALFELFQRVRGDGRARWWLAFGALALLSALTHYYMALVLAAINVYALLTLLPNLKIKTHKATGAEPGSRFAWAWFGSQLLVGGLFVAYLFVSKAAYHLLNQLQGFGLQTIAGRLEPARSMVDDLLWGVQAHPWPWWSGAVLLLAGLGLLVCLLGKPGGWGRWFLPVYALVPLALAVLTPERLNARYLAAIVPAYCLALGAAIAWAGRRHWLLGGALLGVLLAANLNVLHLNRPILKGTYGDMVRYLNAHLRPGDAVILYGPWQWVFQLYYPVEPSAPVYWLPPYPLLSHTRPEREEEEAAAVRQQLEYVASQFERAWVLPVEVKDIDPRGVVGGWLAEHAYYASSYRELELYAFDQQAQPELVQDVQVDFDASGRQVLRLHQLSLPRAAAQPGEPILMSLDVRVFSPIDGDLRIGVQLVDRDGNRWATLALRPGDRFHPPWEWQADDRLVVRQAVLVPPGMPPGEYALRISAFFYPSQASLWPSQDGHPLPEDYVQVNGVRVVPCDECAGASLSTLLDDLNATPLDATFGNGLALLGVRLGGNEFWQGHAATFDLVWQPQRALEQDYTLRLALVDRFGREVSGGQVVPVAAWYPTSLWTPGQVLLDMQGLLIPPRLPAGAYGLRLSVLDANGQPLPLAGTRVESSLGLFQRRLPLSGTALEIGHVQVKPLERTFSVPRVDHPLSVVFYEPGAPQGDGGSLRLLGYDWDGPPQPGQQARLVLYWQAVREMDAAYTVFTHIVGPGETLAGQKDNWPRHGAYPTPFWMKGEIVSDEYVIPFLPQAAANGQPPACPDGQRLYRLEVGLYTAHTAERLRAVQDGQPVPNDAVVLECW